MAIIPIALEPAPNGRAEREQVVERQAERQQPGVLDLEPVVEQRDSDRGAALGVVGVHQRVDERLAQVLRVRRRESGNAVMAEREDQTCVDGG